MSETIWQILTPIIGLAFALTLILGLTVLATAYEPSPNWHLGAETMATYLESDRAQ